MNPLLRASKKVTSLLEPFGITMPRLHRNIEVPHYYQFGIPHHNRKNNLDSLISENGSYVAYSGAFTSQLQKRHYVKDPIREKQIDFTNSCNQPIQRKSLKLLQDMATFYLNTRQRLYVVDGYVCADPDSRIKVRTVCSRTYHALFMQNSLFKPIRKQLQTDFQQGADLIIFNAGEFPCNKYIPGISSQSIVAHNFQQNKHFILGTQYGGQMKACINSHINYIMPKQGKLPLRSTAIYDKNGEASLLLGATRSGKTSLAVNQNWQIIGDQQIIWSQNEIFAVSGGLYPRVTNLNKNAQKIMYNCLKFGSVVENCSFFQTDDRKINFFDITLSDNGRASFPLGYLPNHHDTYLAPHPKNIIILAKDARGVLPLISKLSDQQAIYYYATGYGNVMTRSGGNREFKINFSPCFDINHLSHHPSIYINMFAQKIKKHKPNVYLVNTGYQGGKFPQGKKISIMQSAACIKAVFDNTLSGWQKCPDFGFEVPRQINGVNNPNSSDYWSSKPQFATQTERLLKQISVNFERFKSCQSVYNYRNACSK